VFALCRPQHHESTPNETSQILSEIGEGQIKQVTYLNSFALTSAFKQERPADADRPARRESMPKIAPIRLENKLQTS